MSLEGQLLDRKSLRAVAAKSADWPELAKDCVAFANALGGRLLIGVENGDRAGNPSAAVEDAVDGIGHDGRGHDDRQAKGSALWLGDLTQAPVFGQTRPRIDGARSKSAVQKAPGIPVSARQYGPGTFGRVAKRRPKKWANSGPMGAPQSSKAGTLQRSR